MDQPALQNAPASKRALIQATAIALAVAIVILVTTVLPAEYGIDPIGTGRALGLVRLSGTAPSAPVTVAATPAGPITPQSNDYKVDTIEFSLLPFVGFVEYQYHLEKGATMLYAWKATGKVVFDFHTEPDGKPPAASDSFEKGETNEGRGSYTAPYAGIHGWYWENRSDKVVVIRVTSAGFYTSAIEFRDDGTSVPHNPKALSVSPP